MASAFYSGDFDGFVAKHIFWWRPMLMPYIADA